MTKIILKIKVNELHFQDQPRVSWDACLVQNWWFQPKYVKSYRADKPNILESWVNMAKMTLKIWDQWSPFSIPAESIPEYMFGTNFVILAQICHELSCGRTSQMSLNSWVNMAKMTLRVEISYLHFQYIATGLWLLLWYRRCRWNMQWLFILLHIQMFAALQPEQRFWENTLMPLTRIPS